MIDKEMYLYTCTEESIYQLRISKFWRDYVKWKEKRIERSLLKDYLLQILMEKQSLIQLILTFISKFYWRSSLVRYYKMELKIARWWFSTNTPQPIHKLNLSSLNQRWPLISASTTSAIKYTHLKLLMSQQILKNFQRCLIQKKWKSIFQTWNYDKMKCSNDYNALYCL